MHVLRTIRHGWDSSNRLTKYLVVALLMVTSVLTLSPLALAECKPAGIPATAGDGVAGSIAPQVEAPTGGNLYGEYGFGGMRWNTCDITAFGSPVPDMGAEYSTWIGNTYLDFAATLGAAMTALHGWVGNMTTFLQPLDQVIGQLSDITREVLFNNWILVVVVLAAITIIAAAVTKKVRAALTTALAVCGAIGFVAVVGSAPLQIAQAADGVVASVVSETDARALAFVTESSESGEATATASADEALGAILMDAVLMPMWRMGTVGSAENTDTANNLYRASTISYPEKAENPPSPDDKKNEYNDAVEVIKNNPETAAQYQAIKGQTYVRPGVGGIAAFAMLVIAAVRIPAEGLMLVGVLVMRFIPILGPLFALLAILPVTRPAAIAGLKIVAASVVNVLIFGLIASLHLALIAILYFRMGFNNPYISLVLSLVLTFVFWKFAKPFRSLVRLGKPTESVNALAGTASAPGQAMSATANTITSLVTGSTLANLTKKSSSEGEGNQASKIQRSEPAHNGPETRRTVEETERVQPETSGTQTDGERITPVAAPATTGTGPQAESAERTRVSDAWSRPPRIHVGWQLPPPTGERSAALGKVDLGRLPTFAPSGAPSPAVPRQGLYVPPSVSASSSGAGVQAAPAPAQPSPGLFIPPGYVRANDEHISPT